MSMKQNKKIMIDLLENQIRIDSYGFKIDNYNKTNTYQNEFNSLNSNLNDFDINY